MNEILGRSTWAPNVFGTAAPDTGNAEILAHYGTEEQKKTYLQPLLDGELVSCFSMTEPHAGADPKEFNCSAVKDGNEWVINGEKYFSSHAEFADFIIAMVVTDPDVSVYQGTSMILIPRGDAGRRDPAPRGGCPGSRWARDTIPTCGTTTCAFPRRTCSAVRARASPWRRRGWAAGGSIHAMRTIATTRKALQMMCERALSRHTQGEILAKKQLVQEKIAQSFIEIEQFRLLVLYAAWWCDKGDRDKARTYIAAVKVQMAEVLHDVVRRSLHVHGALGCSNETPLAGMWSSSPVMAIADGPTEVHMVTVAKQVLKQYQPYEGLWPNEFLPRKVAEAKEKFAEFIEHNVANN